MAHIVIMTVGITSHLNSDFKFARQLEDKGHRITFVTSYAPAKQQLKAQGFDYLFLAEESQLTEGRKHLPKLTSPKNRILRRLVRIGNTRQLLSYLIYRSAYLEAAKCLRDYILHNDELNRCVKQLDPDLIFVEYELHHYTLKLSKFNLPIVLIEPHCSTRKAPGVAILYSDRLPTGTFLNSWLIEAEWQATFLKRKTRFAVERLFYQGHDWLSSLKQLAHHVNFSLKERVDFKQWHFLTYKDLPTLYLSAWEFDFPHELPNKAAYVGPMVRLDRQEAASDPYFQATFQPLVAQKQQTNGQHRPLIYCAIGSILSKENFLKRVIQVFANRYDWDLVASVGRQTSLESFGQTPSNVYLFNYVPQLEVLQHADLMVAHGGIGSINEAILFGVPLVVFSGGVLDENGNAARVEYHGLGLRGDMSHDSSTEIERKIDQVLSSQSYKDNALKMQQVYQTYHHADKVSDYVDKLIEQSVRIPNV